MSKIRSLYVRPMRSSDVTFDTAGVVESVSAKVGDVVNPINFQNAVLNQLNATTGSAAILALLGVSPLANLRSPKAAAALDQMVVQRQLAFLKKYKHKSDIVNVYNTVYANTPNGKLGLLGQLQQNEQTRFTGVDAAYTGNNMTGVITQADTSVVSYSGNQTSNVYINSLGMRQPQHMVTVSGQVSSTNTINDTDSIPIQYTGPANPPSYNAANWVPVYASTPTYNSQKTDTSLPTQTVKTKFTDYRDLSTENKMQTANTLLSIQDQLLAQTVANAQVPDLGSILDGELQTIDYELRKAQIAFALLYLTPPIAGRVTAIFKGVGESVAVGEPVMRVEGEDQVFLVGLVQYRSPLTVGMKATVVATEVFEEGGKATIQGTVVAVRGHDSNNDEWDVMISAANTGTQVTLPNGTKQNVIFPLNYQFDRETTTITIK